LREEVRRLTRELETKNRELARRNRLADLGRMASHIAHEVRNGLAPVTLYLSLLRRRIADDPTGLRTMDNIEAAFTALEATVNDLLSFTLDRDPVWRQFNVRDLVSGVCESLAPQLAAQGIRTEIDIDARTFLWADRDMLRRAVFNLVLNALDVMPEGGELVITACESSSGFELEVADSGPGIDEDLRPRVFEPFFTTKSEGTGLGLAIVYRIAEAHGGDAQVVNCPEGGAAFTLRIPQRPMEAAA
jgi:signal transduction histidine kinase